MLQNIKKLIPISLKSKLVNIRFLNRIRARRLAINAKRLDLCAAQFALLLQQSPRISIEEKTCLEIGSGWVLSHAVICYLLGAARVIATDVRPMANPVYLKEAIQKADPAIVRDVLSPFSEHHEIRERFNRLVSIRHFNFETLKSLGIEYLAPYDFVKQDMHSAVDFICSFAVLEHIPVESVRPLLENIARSLKTGGAMIHCIHLEDHKDFNRPFVFLSNSIGAYPEHIQTVRGNRIRRSQWRNYFSDLEEIDFRFIYEWKRTDRELPEIIDPSISYENEDDLRVSHLGVYGRKK